MGRRGRPRGETLTRDQVVDAAIAIADAEGLEGLSMRKLGKAVGVQAMSLYNHVANREALLDALVERIVLEITPPDPDEHWQSAMRKRAHAARAAFTRHPWAVHVMETREHPGPNALAYYEAVLACLRRSGFSIELAATAFSLLDSYLYGFVLQEKSLPFQTPEELAIVAEGIMAGLPRDTHPYFSDMVGHALQPGYSYGKEFAIGLELVLDGLERRRLAEV